MKRCILVLLAVSLLWTSRSAVAAESGWSWKKMFAFPPFQKTTESRSVLVRKPKRTSPLEKLNQSTKAFVAKTRDMAPTSLLPKAQSGLRNTAHAVKSSTTRLGAGLARFGQTILHPWGKEESPKPQTVPEFLAQPRPEF